MWLHAERLNGVGSAKNATWGKQVSLSRKRSPFVIPSPSVLRAWIAVCGRGNAHTKKFGEGGTPVTQDERRTRSPVPARAASFGEWRCERWARAATKVRLERWRGEKNPRFYFPVSGKLIWQTPALIHAPKLTFRIIFHLYPTELFS